MKFVALSGGIGAGKSTVGRMLAERGAVVLDVDQISRELQEPGQPFFEEIVARWGTGVLDPEGRLDRAGLGRIVFGDREQLATLTAMAAPHAERAIVDRAARHLGTDHAVVCEAAMYLVPAYGMTAVVVVDVPADVAVTRLVEDRGMAEDDARARISSQPSREDRLAAAGFVIDNGGDRGALTAAVDAAWDWIRAQPDAVPTLPDRARRAR